MCVGHVLKTGHKQDATMNLVSCFQFGNHTAVQFDVFLTVHHSIDFFQVTNLRADCSPLSTGILYCRLQRVTIPEAVMIKFVLLKMSKVLLETC